MIIIRCPKCNSKVLINIARAVDEHGELFKCDNCNYTFRYAAK